MHMIKAYNDEVRVFRHEIAKSKDKEKRALMKPLALMEKHVPKELFKLILHRSKVLHSLAFFQWRYNNAPGAHIDEIEEIFEGKKTFFKQSIRLLPVDALEPLVKVDHKKEKNKKEGKEESKETTWTEVGEDERPDTREQRIALDEKNDYNVFLQQVFLDKKNLL